MSLDACLVQVTGTRRKDSAGTSFARASLLDFWGLVFSLRVLRLVEGMVCWTLFMGRV